MGKRRQRVAFIYDFDGTLSPGNMQEYDYIPNLHLKPAEFWKEAKERAKANQADEILAYMYLMIRKAKEAELRITKDDFRSFALNIALFNGVEEWFGRINDYVHSKGLMPRHYIISSGIREMLYGTSIAKEFKEIFASSFIYDEYDAAVAAGMAVNYTTKTQFLFRINKGIKNVCDNVKINQYIEDDDRSVPFTNMLFFGDGATDVPCMRLVKSLGGHSVAVYKPNGSKKEAEQLQKDQRVNFIAPADYSKGKRLDNIVHAVVDKIASYWALKKYS